MENDPQIQQAIYASLQASRGTLRADRPSLGSSSGGNGFCSPQRVQRWSSRDLAMSTGGCNLRQSHSEKHGRVDSLRRSGIAPAVTQSRLPSPQPKGSLRRALSGHTAECTSKSTIPRMKSCGEVEGQSRSQSSSDPSFEEGQWRRICGSGCFHVKSVDGLEEGYVENTQADICLISNCLESESNYRLQFDFRCAHAAPASGNLPAFQLLLYFQVLRKGSTMDYVSISVDCRDRFWTLETVNDGKQKELYKVPDRDLRPGVFHTMRVEVRNNTCLSVYCGERCPINNFDLGTDINIAGPFGFAVAKSRLDFCNMKTKNVSGSPPARTVSVYKGDDQHLVETIERDVIDHKLGVTFNDIASLEDAKRLLDEAVTLPLIIPEFFTGIREPWKGVLLFGPPGTGKTLLAKALANMHDIKFFNCCSSTLMSKWRGESEKLVRVLFSMARHYAPSIVFFDEADALISTRGGDGEHEASRRFKSELLQQMDGVTSVIQPGKNVIVLATTNCPWDLDEAMRRRLEKRIYIPLPNVEARQQMLEIYLKDVNCSEDVRLEVLANKLEGYSGADIRLVCRDASLMPMRRLIANKTPSEIKDLRDKGHLEVKLAMEDFSRAIGNTQPSVSPKDVEKFQRWNTEFASS